MNPKTDTPESAEAMSNSVPHCDFDPVIYDAKIALAKLIASAEIPSGWRNVLVLDERQAMFLADKIVFAAATAQQSAITLKHAETAERLQRCEDALGRVVYLIDRAKVENLMRGVQLGQISWCVKMNDAMTDAHAALTHPTRNEGEKKV